MAVSKLFQRIDVPLILALFVPLALILGRAVADITMGVVSLTFLITCIARRDFSWLRQSWAKMTLVVWAYLMISALLSPYDKNLALSRAFEWLRFPLFAAAMAVWIIPRQPDRKYLRWSLIALCAFVCIDTIAQYMFGTSLTGHVKPDYPGRLSGPFDRLVVGVFLLHLAWPAIGLCFDYCRNFPRFWQQFVPPVALTGLLALTLLLSGNAQCSACSV